MQVTARFEYYYISQRYLVYNLAEISVGVTTSGTEDATAILKVSEIPTE